MLKILILVSSLHTGDSAQMEEILKAFSKANQKVETYRIDSNQDFKIAKTEYQNKAKLIPSKDKYITLAIGEEGMKLLDYLENSNSLDYSRSYTCLCIHQYFTEIAKLKLDQIIVPEITIDKPEEKKVINKIPNVTYVFTPLGDHPTEAELKTSFDNWANKPPLNRKYIIVMLAGDAPDGSNNMKYFTKASAKQLFQFVHKLWSDNNKQHIIIVENGPRTGKFNPTTGEIISTHEYSPGQNPEMAVDYISNYFIELLKTSKMNYEFYNFAVEIDENKRKSISYHKALLYLAEQPGNFFILPGDSVSSIGQIPLYLTSDKIILFKPSSMNEDHTQVVDLAFKKNYLSYFSDNGEIIMPTNITKRNEDDSSLVIKSILQGYSNKFDH